MANLKFKTKDNSHPQGKPRVYFCCHPADFNEYFDKVCGELFSKQNCAVWYVDEPTERDDEFLSDLSQMQLFVLPVTHNFLAHDNVAYTEFLYAAQNNIPVLPLMMEEGIEDLFNARCGDIQLLGRSNDETAISYDEKLRKYLKTVLTSDEQSEKIRAAFDAYVFLSYRKKDRRYAQQLMRLIHKNEFCRDIAIWYDEFLTPGENFNESIKEAIKKSGLFVLTVTPNLVNETNYVMTTEYPMAKEEGKPILPAELVPTDRAVLAEKYVGIPTPADANKESELTEALLEAVKKMAIKENDSSPEHNYFIGLAYLNGIDVEVDRARALELITMAAEADLPEAIKKLYGMYSSGAGVKRDYNKALYWIEKLARLREKTDSADSERLANVYHSLVEAYENAGKYSDALIWAEKAYEIYVKLRGEEDRVSLIALATIGRIRGRIGDYKKALEYAEKTHEVRKRTLGEDHKDIAGSYLRVAVAHYNLGDYKKALEYYEKSYACYCEHFGNESDYAVSRILDIATVYNSLGDYKKALEYAEKVYTICKKTYSESHYRMAAVYVAFANAYSGLGDYKKALEYSEKAYNIRLDVLGERHPLTLVSTANLAILYSKLGQQQKAYGLYKKVYEIREKELGEEHPATLSALTGLSKTANSLGKYSESLGYAQKAYDSYCRTIGEEHPSALAALNNIAVAYGALGKYEDALEAYQKVHAAEVKARGEKTPFAIIALSNVSTAYMQLGKYDDALKAGTRVYELRRENLGERHPDTATSLSGIAHIYLQKRNYKKARKLCEEVYSVYLEKLGENHPQTALMLNNLAVANFGCKDSKKALEYSSLAEEQYKAIYGADHINVLLITSNNALLSAKAGYKEGVEARCYNSYKKMSDNVGDKNLKTLGLLMNWARACYELGYYRKAMRLVRRANKGVCELVGPKHAYAKACKGIYRKAAFFYIITGFKNN
ncbi:MAG: tetratricopeptide repeat protein [Clostridia bacterium]|nr:tetratricopeptide repeat protein [Clostridia bacterium]